MSSTLALNAVSAAIYGALNVVGLTTLAPGGVHDELPQRKGQLFPCVVFNVLEAEQVGGFGTRPGVAGWLPKLEVRVSVYTESSPLKSGKKERQEVMAKVLELLSIAPAVTGYTSPTIFWFDDVDGLDDVVAGVEVKELAKHADFYVETA